MQFLQDVLWDMLRLYILCSVSLSPDVRQVCQPLQETQRPPNTPPQRQAATVWKFHQALCSNWLPVGYHGLQKQMASSQFLQVAMQLIVMQVFTKRIAAFMGIEKKSKPLES